MSDFKQWWGDRQLMTGMAESEEAWDYQQARILELEAELAESIDRHQGMIDKAMEMSKELSGLRKAANEIWEADQEGRATMYSKRLSDAIDKLEPLLGEQR